MKQTEIIYDLCKQEEHSNDYYEVIKQVTFHVKQQLLSEMRNEIKDFQMFIRRSELEAVRSEVEYGLEILMLGIFWWIYGKQAQTISKMKSKALMRIAKMRKDSKRMKPVLSRLKGTLTQRYLLRQNEISQPECDLQKLILWLKATGEYEEESIRLEQWQCFLSEQGQSRQEAFKEKVIDFAKVFEKAVEGPLKPYIAGVEYFRRQRASNPNKREDQVFCMQPAIMYYLNMVGAQLLNEAYRADYINAQKYVIFLPGCMTYQGKERCKAREQDGAYICQGCTKACQVYQMSQLAHNYGAKVMVLYHESQLNKQSVKDRKVRMGVIGVACVLSLISGGFKAKRLGYVPQCVLLDYCGCKQHWTKEGKVTRLNVKELKNILEI